jgi:hypothetical protein
MKIPLGQDTDIETSPRLMGIADLLVPTKWSHDSQRCLSVAGGLPFYELIPD